MKQLEEKKLNSGKFSNFDTIDKSSENRRDRRLYEISNEYSAEGHKEEIYNYQKQGENESLQTVVGVHTLTMPSTTHLKEKSSNKSDSSQGMIEHNFLSRNIGASTFDKKIEKNYTGDQEFLKCGRGLQIDQNKENIFINNLIINDDGTRQSFTEMKKHRELMDFDDRN